MINLDQLSAKGTALATAMKDELRREVERIAQSGRELVINRLGETGRDSVGGQFPPYTHPYELRKRGAVSTAKGEGKKRRAARREAEATAEKPVGRYKGFRDFTFSGRMFKNINLQETQQDRGRIVVRVSGIGEETLDKMEGNENVTPGWFRISDDEVKRIAEQSQVRLTKYAKDFTNT